MTALRTVLLAAPAIVAMLAVVAGVALQHQAAQAFSRMIAISRVVLADDCDDDNDLAQQEEGEHEQHP